MTDKLHRICKNKTHSTSRRKNRIAAAFTLLASLLGAQSYADVSCDVKVVNKWDEFSRVKVTVTNTGDSVVDDWAVELSYSDESHLITDSWNSQLSGNMPYVFIKSSTSSALGPGEVQIFGFDTLHANNEVETPLLLACGDNTPFEKPVVNRDMLIVHDEALDLADISLNDVFDNLSTIDNVSAPNGAALFRQFWDSQREPTVLGGEISCTTHLNDFGNTFQTLPECNRIETNFAFLDESQLVGEMQAYELLAVVNRIDLRRGNWQDCGEHRMVFGLNSFESGIFSFGRNFFIFEARVPNPIPGDINGCSNVINAWHSIGNAENAGEQGKNIRELFITGGQFGGPIFEPSNFTQDTGQIRTNQFVSFEWMLKEHKLLFSQNAVGEGLILAANVPVKENPIGQLFNGNIANDGSDLGELAAQFQDEFLDSWSTVSMNDFAKLANPIPLQFNASQSFASGFRASNNNYVNFFNQGSGSEFSQAVSERLADTRDINGTFLSAQQVLNRATALTCAGCHQPSSFGLTAPGSIGAMILPEGKTRDSWPSTLGFVHIDEARNISPALNEVFLPVREQGFVDVLRVLSIKN